MKYKCCLLHDWNCCRHPDRGLQVCLFLWLWWHNELDWNDLQTGPLDGLSKKHSCYGSEYPHSASYGAVKRSFEYFGHDRFSFIGMDAPTRAFELYSLMKNGRYLIWLWWWIRISPACLLWVSIFVESALRKIWSWLPLINWPVWSIKAGKSRPCTRVMNDLHSPFGEKQDGLKHVL